MRAAGGGGRIYFRLLSKKKELKPRRRMEEGSGTGVKSTIKVAGVEPSEEPNWRAVRLVPSASEMRNHP